MLVIYGFYRLLVYSNKYVLLIQYIIISININKFICLFIFQFKTNIKF